jgi:hypothetical protein
MAACPDIECAPEQLARVFARFLDQSPNRSSWSRCGFRLNGRLNGVNGAARNLARTLLSRSEDQCGRSGGDRLLDMGLNKSRTHVFIVDSEMRPVPAENSERQCSPERVLQSVVRKHNTMRRRAPDPR